MLRKIILILILTAIFISCSETKKPVKKKHDNVFTNIRACFVYKKPSLKSEKINFLPFGTKLKVKKAISAATFKGKKTRWYYGYNIRGYVLASQVQKTLPAKDVNLKIFINSGSGKLNTDLFTRYKGKIVLSKNNFRFYISFKSPEYSQDYYHGGVYKIRGEKIILQSKYCFKKIFGGSYKIQNKIAFPKLKNFKLLYVDFLPGFIYDKDKKVLDKKKYYLNRRKKFFISHQDLEKMETGKGWSTKIGYFYY